MYQFRKTQMEARMYLSMLPSNPYHWWKQYEMKTDSFFKSFFVHVIICNKKIVKNIKYLGQGKSMSFLLNSTYSLVASSPEQITLLQLSLSLQTY